jgi:hypothetical protein
MALNSVMQGVPELEAIQAQQAQDAAPAAPQPGVPSGVAALAPAVQPTSAAPARTAAPQQAAPENNGSLASKLAASWLTHLQNFDKSMTNAASDASHASDKPGGWLTGVTNTLNARSQRLAAQDKAAEETKRNDILNAKTAAETVALHRNIYAQDTATRQSAYKGNQAFSDTFKENHDIDPGVNHTELMKRFKADPNFADKYYVRATADEPMLDSTGLPREDKNGNPITSPTYDIITRATKNGEKDDKTAAADWSGDLKKYTGQDIPVNTKLTTGQYAAMDGQLNLTRNAVNIIQSTNEKELSDEQLKVLRPYLTDATIQAAISHIPGSAYAGLLEYEKNADLHVADLQAKADAAQKAGDQAAVQKFQQQASDIVAEQGKVRTFMSQAITPKQVERYDKEVEKKTQGQTDLITEISKDPTKIEGKTSSVMAAAQGIISDPNASAEKKVAAARVLKQAQDTRAMEIQLDGAKELEKANVKKGAADRSNPSGLTGAAFIKTLPPGRAAALKAINDGSVAVNPSALERSDKGQAYMDDIYAAYPDFQAYKGETWPKAYNEYMGSGATAKAKVNYNTALSHLQDLYNNSTAQGLYQVGSKPYEDRKAAYTIVVNEVGKAVKSGVITQGEGDELSASLNGWLPSTAKERTAHVAGLLKNKIDEFQNAFQDAAPSAQIKTPTLMSPQAQAAYDYIQSGGKAGGQQAQNPNVIAQNLKASQHVTTADGKTTIYQVGNQWVTADGQPYKP